MLRYLGLAVASTGCSLVLGIDDLEGPADGGGPPDGSGLCEQQSFDGPIVPPWFTFSGTAATASVTGNELVLGMAALSPDDYAGGGLEPRDLTGAALEVDVTRYPSKPGSDAHIQWRVGTELYSLHFEAGQVEVRGQNGAIAGPQPIDAGDVTWRVEHRIATNVWAASVLRGGQWVDRGAVTATLPTTNLNVIVTAGTYTGVDAPGEVHFDNIRLFCP